MWSEARWIRGESGKRFGESGSKGVRIEGSQSRWRSEARGVRGKGSQRRRKSEAEVKGQKRGLIRSQTRVVRSERGERRGGSELSWVIVEGVRG